MSAASMANHLSAIKANLALFGLLTDSFAYPRIKYFQKAMILHRSFKVGLKKIIDVHTLQLIVRACDFTYMGQVFKAVFTHNYTTYLLAGVWGHYGQELSSICPLRFCFS